MTMPPPSAQPPQQPPQSAQPPLSAQAPPTWPPNGSGAAAGAVGPHQLGGAEQQGRRRRPDVLPKVILQAHATRAAVAQALLLHGHERTARQLRKPLPALITGVIVALIITVAFFIAIRLGSLPKR